MRIVVAAAGGKGYEAEAFWKDKDGSGCNRFACYFQEGIFALLTWEHQECGAFCMQTMCSVTGSMPFPDIP